MTAVSIHFRLHHPEAAASFARLVADDARFSAVLPGTPEDAAASGLVVAEVRTAQNVSVISDLLALPEVREVFVLGPAQDADLILASMRAGATEYLPFPLKVGEFRAALDRFTVRTAHSTQTAASHPQRLGRVIHLLGGKPGTGVTTLAVNLGVEASALDGARPAALVDMRQPQGEVPLFLDMHYTHTWAAATHNAHRLDDAFMQSLMVRHASGLDILAAPDRSEDTGSAAPQAIGTMLRILRSLYSTVFVDGSPLVDELSLASMREADAVLMVTELSLPCLANTRRLLETLDNAEPDVADKVRLIANRYTPKAGVALAEAEELLGRPIAWKVDEDYVAAVSAINQGTPLRDSAPKSPLTRNIGKLATTFVRTEAQRKASGLFGRLFRNGADDLAETPLHVLQGAGG